MKLTHSVKRKLLQIVAFGFSDPYIWNFAKGKIYQGKWKNFCNLGMNCYSCPAAQLACPIGAMQAVSDSMNFNFSFYVVGIILAVGVVLGRWVFGFLCPFGLIQELIAKIPIPKVKQPKALTYVKYVVLVLFVLIFSVAITNYAGVGKPMFCEFICPAGTLEGGIPLLLMRPDLAQAIGALFSLKATILLGTLVGCMFIPRFFCKLLCPLGAIYGLLNKVSLYHLNVDKEQCVHCGKCAKICPMDVDPTKTPSKWIAFILNQIIGNAVKYCREEGRQLQISSRTEKNCIVLSVWDNGIGIPVQDQAKVFDKGFTGENGRHFGKSTGIGLYLCKKLCECLGIGITLESKLGEGTSVQLIFPIGEYHSEVKSSR